jgi:putative copper export protein
MLVPIEQFALYTILALVFALILISFFRLWINKAKKTQTNFLAERKWNQTMFLLVLGSIIVIMTMFAIEFLR